MRRLIVLDTNVLGILANPRRSIASDVCRAWFEALLNADDTVILPEIADYELRREMLLNGASDSIEQLDALRNQARYVRLTTETMQLAAAFWANIRKQGQPTADRHALDGDVILAAQARLLDDPGDGIIIATTNVKHLIRFADARLWAAIGVSA